MTHILIPREPSAALLRPFIGCNTQELHEAWAAMVRAAEVQNARAGAAPAEVVGWLHPQWAAEQGRGRIYGHNPGGYIAVQIAAPQAPAAPILGDAERLAAARQDKSLADYWRNRVAGLAEEFTTAEAALYLADRIVADLYDLPQAGVARPAAPAAPVLGRSVAEALKDLQEMWDDMAKSSSGPSHERTMRRFGDALSTIERTVAAPAAPAVDAWLQPDDMAALQRFHETAEDDESYDIGKEAVARLCAFGCLQSHSFGRYSTTDFGEYLLDTWAGARTLPFTTAAERDARAAQAAAKGSTQHERLFRPTQGPDLPPPRARAAHRALHPARQGLSPHLPGVWLCASRHPR
ncbi:hypothetical protein ACHFCA_16680 [Delftia tsuruhatensis]